jgi:hypothetical protein
MGLLFGLFSAICAAIALKLCTWLYINNLQIKFEDGCYQPIFSSPELKAQVSYSDRLLSVIRLFVCL